MTILSISIRRATFQGYLVFLLGMLLIVENVLSALTTGDFYTDIIGIALGLFAIGGGVLSYLRPEQLSRGTEPAPTYLYVIAGIATVAFVFWIFFMLQG
ncbi:hypothetical protein C448_07332 [Halococcus morrhuae DSM 1307]|uniref:Uncharacterized protein n=1 Tax=Halococcus morrhuae DSM 1307 TaxID=931277 RepID=M0MMG4_HALMO|nr:hypothetical protein C448_07332 [Halococcus morrhuae DSM 1307]